MSPAAPLSALTGFARVRRTLCATCPTPCARQHEFAHYTDPAAACPLPAPRWRARGASIVAKVRAAPAPVAEPTVAELAGNFSGAVARWVSAGAPVVSRLTYEVRAATCAACPQWDGSARFGLGRCRAPGCGCTSLKRWLATEKCPLGKWPERADL